MSHTAHGLAPRHHKGAGERGKIWKTKEGKSSRLKRANGGKSELDRRKGTSKESGGTSHLRKESRGARELDDVANEEMWARVMRGERG